MSRSIVTVLIGVPSILLFSADAANAQRSSPYYKHEILAKGGESGIGWIAGWPTIDGQGRVAFLGSTSPGPGGSGVVAVDGRSPVRNLTEGAQNPNRAYLGFPEISDSGVVIAQYSEQVFGDFISVIRPLSARDPNERFDNIVSSRLFQISRLAEFRDIRSPTINSEGRVVFCAYRGQNDLLFSCFSDCLVAAPPDGSGFIFRSGHYVLPSLAEDGSVALAEVEGGSIVLKVCTPDLAVCQPIAGPAFGFQNLSARNAISAQGSAVAFIGDRGEGRRGVFLAMKHPSGDWEIVEISLEGSADLGVDDDGFSVSLEDFDFAERVSVIHLEAGDAGLADDSFVIAFVARPSSSSVINPNTGAPLFYSSNPGIFTIRLDVDRDRMDPTRLRYHLTSPQPVVQVGDVIGGHQVNYLLSFDLAHARTDASGAPREIRRGDHRIAYCANTPSGEIVVRATRTDSDQDGLLDHWETEGIDLNGDGIAELDLSAAGATPNERDLFLEIDWLAPFEKEVRESLFLLIEIAPPQESIDYLVEMFANAPSPGDGIPSGIRLHVDAGPDLSRNLGSLLPQGGDEVQPSNGPRSGTIYYGKPGSWTGAPGADSFAGIKATHFGDADAGARRFAFRYAFIGETIGQAPDIILEAAGIGESGQSSTDPHVPLPGDDILLADIKVFADFPLGQCEFDVLAHELGHTLGLRHGGIDDVTSLPPEQSTHDPARYRPQYRSVMNYAYPLTDGVKVGGVNRLQTEHESFKGAAGVADLRGLLVRIVNSPAGATGQERLILGNDEDQITLVDRAWDVIPETGSRMAVILRDFSRNDDPVFDDWSHIRLDFQNFYGASSADLRVDSETIQQEVTRQHIIERYGPLDAGAPAGKVDSPAPGAILPGDAPITIRFTAKDDSGIASAFVRADLNGDGEITEDEIFLATSVGGDVYEVTIEELRGRAGLMSLEIVAKDLAGRSRVIGEITADVPNAAPEASPDTYVVAQDDVLAVVGSNGVLANDRDPNGDSLRASLVSPPTDGTLVLNANGSFSYRPAGGFIGMDSFRYTASDGELTSTETTVTFDVRPASGGGGTSIHHRFPGPLLTVGRSGTVSTADYDGFLLESFDLNQDGRADLIASNTVDRDISVLLGRGSGAFEPHQRFSAGAAPFGGPGRIWLLQLDAEPPMDLLIDNGLGGFGELGYRVLLGNGDGTFQEPLDVAIPGSTPRTAFADLDGDGDIDLVRGGTGSLSGIHVRRNRGDGTFDSIRQPMGQIDRIGIGDLDGDGSLDVVGLEGLALRFYRGHGDGSFASPTVMGAAVRSVPRWVEVDDLDADGSLDVLALAEDHVTFLAGNGDGTVRPGAVFDITRTTGLRSTYAEIADMNGDGSPDVALFGTRITAVLEEAFVTLVNQGDGTFEAAPHEFEPALGGQINRIFTADLNDDDVLDMAYVSTDEQAGLAVALGKGDGSFEPVEHTLVSASSSPNNTSPALADLDGDGDLDFAVLTAGDKVQLVFGKGDGTFPGRLGPHPVGSTRHAPALGDFDRDGKLDAAVANIGGTVSILFGKGDGTFEPEVVISDGSESDWGRGIVAIDLNDDSILDLVTAHEGIGSPTELSIHIGNGDGTFQPFTRLAAGVDPLSVAAADLDGDGTIDIAATNMGSNNVSIFLGAGDGSFSELPERLETGVRPEFIALSDLDGDGAIDIAVSNRGSGNVSIHFGNGNGTFTPAATLPVGSEPRTIVVGDFDENGASDLAVSSNTQHSLLVFRNAGSRSFLPAESYDVTPFPWGLAAADIDGDGDLDLHVTSVGTSGQADASLSLLLGRGDGTFEPEVRFRTSFNAYDPAIADINDDGLLDWVMESGRQVYTYLQIPVAEPPPPGAPLANAGGPYEASEAQTFRLDASSSSDADGDIVSYEWDLDGDGEHDDASGASPAVTFANDGEHIIALRVIDTDGLADTSMALVTVTNTAPELELPSRLSGLEGEPLDLGSVRIRDPGTADEHSARVEWGDGREDSYEPESLAAGTLSMAAHVYAQDGEYSARICVSDDGGAEVCADLLVEIANDPPLVSGGADRTVALGETLWLSPVGFRDRGLEEAHTASIDWGDGTVESGNVRRVLGGGHVFASHAYSTTGEYTVQICVSDEAATGCDDVLVTVTAPETKEPPEVEVAQGEVGRVGEPFTLVFSFTDLNTRESHTAQIDWGDGTAPTPASLLEGSSVGSGRGVHLYGAPGVYTVTVEVCDDTHCTQVESEVRIVSQGEAAFRRGDVTCDGCVNSYDAVILMGYLAGNGLSLCCLDAADANDDGQVAPSDVVLIVGHILGNGPPPPLPGSTACGPDATDDELGCDAYPPLACATPCGLRQPGDCNSDGSFNISDPICLLGFLFTGTPAELPCVSTAANLSLFDANGDGKLDLSDPVASLRYLFLGGPSPVPCIDGSCHLCMPVSGCAPSCSP